MSKTGETPLRAGEGARTLDNNIGNVVLCQLSYARITLYNAFESRQIVIELYQRPSTAQGVFFKISIYALNALPRPFKLTLGP